MSGAARQLRLAVFVSGHGFGHLTRTSAVLSALAARARIQLTVFTAAPKALWPTTLEPLTPRWVGIACDAGVVQTDDLHVDAAATRQAVGSWLDGSAAARAAVVRELERAGGIDCVVGDVPPLAFEAAAELGVPSVAIANFSWDWIYESLGLDEAAAAARRAYRNATLLLALTPTTPMPAFARRVDVDVVGRRAERDPGETRRGLGLAPGDLCVLLSLRSPALERVCLPPARAGLRFLSPVPLPSGRSDVAVIPAAVDYLDALAAADVVLSKTGYSIVGDCAANGGRLLWASRSGFPEDAYLARWLRGQSWSAETSVEALAGGAWGPTLESLSARPRASFSVDRALARAADEIVALLRQ